MCSHLYINKKFYAHLVEIKENSAIDHIGKGFIIIQAHLVIVLNVLNLRACNVHFHRLVPHICRVVQPRDGLGCVAHDKQVHFKAQFDELDTKIIFSIFLEIANFTGVEFGITTLEVEKVPDLSH